MDVILFIGRDYVIMDLKVNLFQKISKNIFAQRFRSTPSPSASILMNSIPRFSNVLKSYSPSPT